MPKDYQGFFNPEDYDDDDEFNEDEEQEDTSFDFGDNVAPEEEKEKTLEERFKDDPTSLNKRELDSLAREKGIKGYSSLRKDDLIQKLSDSASDIAKEFLVADEVVTSSQEELEDLIPKEPTTEQAEIEKEIKKQESSYSPNRSKELKTAFNHDPMSLKKADLIELGESLGVTGIKSKNKAEIVRRISEVAPASENAPDSNFSSQKRGGKAQISESYDFEGFRRNLQSRNQQQEDTRARLESKNVGQLRKIAKSAGLSKYSSWSKQQLIDSILDVEPKPEEVGFTKPYTDFASRPTVDLTQAEEPKPEEADDAPLFNNINSSDYDFEAEKDFYSANTNAYKDHAKKVDDLFALEEDLKFAKENYTANLNAFGENDMRTKLAAEELKELEDRAGAAEASSSSTVQPPSSGSGGTPPKPPTTFDDPGGEDDEEFEKVIKKTPAELKREKAKLAARQKREAKATIRQQRSELELQKKADARDLRQRRLFEKLEQKKLYDDIQTEMSTQERATSSDRIIRRLGAFGIARAIGGSGQLFASLVELAVFQPEEAAYREQQEEIQKRIEQEKFDKQLETITKSNELEAIQDETDHEISRIIQETELRLNSDEDVDIDEVQEKINNLYQKGRERKAEVLGRTGSTQPTSPSGTPTASTQPDNTIETPEEAVESPTPSGSQPTGTPTPVQPQQQHNKPSEEDENAVDKLNSETGDLVKQFSKLGEGLQTTTKVILATNIAIEAMSLVSEAFTNVIKGVGRLTSDPRNVQTSMAGAMDLFGTGAAAGSTVIGGGTGAMVGRTAALGSATGKAASVTARTAGTFIGRGAATATGAAAGATGAAVGGTLGSMAVPVLGTVIGAAVGKAITDSLVGPAIELVSLVSGIFNTLKSESIGPESIQATVQQELAILNDQIERSFRMDSNVAELTMLETDLSLAINQFKEEILKQFGPQLGTLVKIATEIIQKLSFFLQMIPDVNTLEAAINAYLSLSPNISRALETLELIHDIMVKFGLLNNRNNVDPGLLKELEDFFMTSDQFNRTDPTTGVSSSIFSNLP